MKVHSIAKVFGMSVNQFCDVIGYSRQYLHMVKGGTSKVVPRRWKAAMDSLEFDINAKYDIDIQKAERDKKTRMEMLDELRKWPTEKVTPCP